MLSIDVRHITKRYKIRSLDSNWRKRLRQSLRIEQTEWLTALNDISFSVDNGEIFGLLGPNGAGKTTLIKILAGLLIPDEGAATINGYNIIKDRKKVRMSVNILMSGGWVIFDYKLSIFNNLKFWGVFEGIPLNKVKQRIEDVLSLVGLIDRKNDFPENLSAGFRQRLNLARCLLSDRPIYLLDEPTANADPHSAGLLREHILKLKKEGKTIVLATHNLWEAEMLCDRIAILDRGRVLVLDKTDSIKKAIGHEIARIEITQCSNELIREVSSLNWVKKVVENDNTNTIEVYGEVRHNLPIIIDICRKYTEIVSVDIQEPTLNQVFFYLLGDKKEGVV